jgi:hypothetical protein
MRIPSHALRCAVAAATLIVNLNAASVAHARSYQRHHHSAKQQHPYDLRGRYYPGAPQRCAPFTRDKMNDAILFGDSKFLTCNY